MGPDVSRRKFIASVVAAGTASAATVVLGRGPAWAADSLVGVTWGGAQIEASKALAEKFSSQVKPTTFSWELHQGGAANILPKIRATWPQVKYDEYYAAAIGAGPTNAKAKPIPELSRYFYKPDEIERFAYFPDFPLINSQMQGIVKRFETEIVPLIRKA